MSKDDEVAKEISKILARLNPGKTSPEINIQNKTEVENTNPGRIEDDVERPPVVIEPRERDKPNQNKISVGQGMKNFPSVLKSKIIEAKDSGKAWLLLIIILLLIGIVVYFFLYPAIYGTWNRIVEEQGGRDEAIAYIWNTITDAFGKISPMKWLDRQRRMIELAAEGDLYTGQVDENAQERLGVFVEEIGQTGTSFYVDEPITVWAHLKAKTLEKPINISVSCSADDLPYDILHPKTEFNVDVEEEQDLDCTFLKNRLEPGLKKFKFQAVFNFETMSYLKTYFMDRQTMRTMQRENIDIAERFGITDTNPIAVYTSGPIGIGIEIYKPPVGIDKEASYDVDLPLGIGLLNNWEGTMLDVTKLVIMLPIGMEFIPDQDDENAGDLTFCGGYTFIGCDEASADMDVGKECDENQGLNTIYILDQRGINNTKLIENERKAIDFYKNIRCRMRIPPENFETVLGDRPIRTLYFKVTAGYRYKIEESRSITIKQGSTEKSKIDQIKCNKDIELKRDLGLPGNNDSTMNERYAKYQSIVKKYVRENLPKDMEKEEDEAMIATIMEIASGVGDIYLGTSIDKDKDGLPDYIAGCWEFKDAPYTHQDNVDVDISCATLELQRYLNDNKDDIEGAFMTYFHGDKDNHKDNWRNSYLNSRERSIPEREEIMNHYYRWLNVLCLVDKKEAEGNNIEGENIVNASAEGNENTDGGEGNTDGGSNVLTMDPGSTEISDTKIIFGFGTKETEDRVMIREIGETTTHKTDDGYTAKKYVEVKNLKPGTEYEYYLESQEVNPPYRIFRYPESGFEAIKTANTVNEE